MPNVWIDRLFERFAGRYGRRFLDMWAGLDMAAVKQTWADDLAGFSADEIRAGLDKCKALDWPPSSPEFIKLCRTELSPETAYYQAMYAMLSRKWPSALVYWSAQKFTEWDLRQSNWQTAKGRWAHCFNEMREIEKKYGLEDIPPPMVALPSPGETSISPEEAKRRIDSMRDILAGKMIIGKD